MVKLRKATNSLKGVSADYEWENQIIEKDNCNGYWYCTPLFKGIQFSSLKDIRKALQIYVDNGRVKPSQYQLMINGINC